MTGARVPIEFKWFGTYAASAGAPLILDGVVVGQLTEPITSSRGVYGGVTARAIVDAWLVDKMGDNSGYGFPKVSFLIARK